MSIYVENPQENFKNHLKGVDISNLDFLQKNNVTQSEFVKSLWSLFSESQQQKENKDLKITDDEINNFIEKCIVNTQQDNIECLQQLFSPLDNIDNDNFSTDFLQFVINMFKECKDMNLIKRLAFNLKIKFITSDKCESISDYKNHYNDDSKDFVQYIKELNNKEIEKKYKMFNDLFLRIIEILINKINNKITLNEKESEPSVNPLAIYKQQFTRKQLESNPIYYPFSPVVFFGGYNYEFKKNNNQSVIILRKIFNSLIRELRLRNKILNNEDIKKVNDILDILEKTEDELTKFIVNALNNIKNMDSTAQQKCLDDLNKEYTKKQEKIYTITQKLNAILDYLIDTQNIKIKN